MDGSVNDGIFTENGSLIHWNILADGVSGRVKGDGSKVYYLKDHLGSTRSVIDEAGEIQESHDYYPFGLVMPGRDFVSGSPTTKELFTGKERDEETGLDYFGARYYDASIGRWLSVDPWDYKYPSLSPYNYTSNNPINIVDQNGKGFTGLPIFAYLNAQLEYGASLKKPPSPTKSAIAAVRTLVRNPGSKSSIGLAVIGGFVAAKLGSDLLQGLGHLMAELTEDGASSSEENTEKTNDEDTAETEQTEGKKAFDSSKSERHGDSGWALDKADKQIKELQEKLKNATKKEAKKIKQKIKNIRETAQKKNKGDTDWRRN